MIYIMGVLQLDKISFFNVDKSLSEVRYNAVIRYVYWYIQYDKKALEFNVFSINVYIV